jgi:hypothetical protein
VATLTEQMTLAGNRTFSARLQAGAATVALEVLVEADVVRGNALRRSMALAVLGSPAAFEYRLALAVLTDPSTYTEQVGKAGGDAQSDAVLLARLRAMWSVLAGVPPEPISP